MHFFVVVCFAMDQWPCYCKQFMSSKLNTDHIGILLCYVILFSFHDVMVEKYSDCFTAYFSFQGEHVS